MKIKELIASKMNRDKSAETRDDVTAEEEENVETFLLHGSLKPLVLQPKPTVSAGKRRWRLLRYGGRATRRRSSLTRPEEKLLRAISKPKSTTSVHDTKHDEQRVSVESKRCSIRNSIVSRRSSLTEIEYSYLEKLLESEEIMLEDLEKCFKVLSKDPLFQEHGSSKSMASSRPSLTRPKLQANDASFRKETWEHYISTSCRSSGDLFTQSKGEKEEQLEEPSKPVQSSSWTEKFFRATDEEKKEEEPQDEKEILSPPCILATSADDETCNPHVLSPPIMDALRPHMPYAIQEDNFWLKYSMLRDGASMRALLQNIRSSAKAIIAIETIDGDVFGSFTSSPWRPNGRGYYGSCEAFMWRLKKSRFTPCDTVEDQIRLESELEVFPWAGENRNVQFLVNLDSQLVMGGGGPDDDRFAECEDSRSALILEPCLTRGTSDRSLTFKNPSLPLKGRNTFEIANIEAWTMTPVENLDKAIKLELGRKFVFDHGNFAEQ